MKTLSLSLLMLLTAALLGACSEPAPQLKNGQAPPAFELPHLEGTVARFPDDYGGKLMALRFWADWCPFCESEMQALEPVYQEYRDRGLVILAINVRQDRQTAAAFVQRLGVSYDTLLDEEGVVARDYGVLGLPTTFLVDRDGRLIGKIIGESTPQMFTSMLEGHF